MQTIAILNMKGGVGKTTTALNMGYLLSTKNNVLLIDADPQGNLTRFFSDEEHEITLEDVLCGSVRLEDAAVDTKYSRLNIIPADGRLAVAEDELTRKQEYTQLAKAIGEIKGIDYCIIDCSPNISSKINIAALAAADEIIIPVEIGKFCFDGFEELGRQVQNIKDGGLNRNLKIKGILITKYSKTLVNISGKKALQAQGKFHVFKTVIHRSTIVDQSIFQSMPLERYAIKSKPAADYRHFISEYFKCSN